MDENSTEKVIEKVLEHFKEEKLSTIVLAGESGIGKTWIARRVSLFAIKQDLVDLTLWAFLSLRYSQRDLYEHLARQLSLLYTSAEWEDDGNGEAENVAEKEESLESLKKRIQDRLSGARVLLVLDDEGNKMNEGDGQIIELLELLQHSPANSPCEVSNISKPRMKVLITSLNKRNKHQDIENTKKVINIRPLTLEVSVSLLQRKAGPETFSIPIAGSFVQNYINKKKGLTPVEVGLLEKLLRCHKDNSRGQHLELALEEASHADNFNFAHLVGSGYGKVPDKVLLDFSWQGTHYFRDQVPVRFNELISYWIMEGYLGPVDCIEKAYEEGYCILMELMDCGMVKKVSDDYLVMERVNLDLNDQHHCGIGGTAKLGLAHVLGDGYKGIGFGKVTLMNGTIRTLGSSSKGCQTLLLGGNSLSEEDLYLSQINQALQILGLFSLRIVELPQSLPKLKKLDVLVVRGCEFLNSIGGIKHLCMLTVLEISGSQGITCIPDDFFYYLKQLRSLNLSGLQVAELPQSFYDLTDLRWLVLKDCSKLTKLKSLKRCENLMVLDLSGTSSLTFFPEKNLKSLPKLQMLNLSRSTIKALPILRENKQLTHLVLSGCQNMNRVPSLRSLMYLQVLDLSNSNIKEFHDRSLEGNHSLKILDLSGTRLISNYLPSDFGNPRQLHMKGCSTVKYITCEVSPKDLEILDLSGSSSLAGIADEFFKHLENLLVLNLTGTKLEVLPSLSALHNLRELFLSSCSHLMKLPSLASMRKLKVLDLSDCKALTILEDESFECLSCLRWLSFSRTQIKKIPELKYLSNLEELNLHGVNAFVNADFLAHMHNLCTLDLSETSLEQLPSLSNLKNLKLLRLSGCRMLVSFPSLQELQKLEILDLSHTKVRSLPSLERLSNLRELLLEGCSDLEDFANMRMVGLSGDIKDLPCGISKLEKLVHLSLPRKESPGAVDSCCISSLSDNSNRSFISLGGLDFSDSSLWSNISEHFYFSVHPVKQQSGSGGLYIFKDKFVFRDIYFLSRHFAVPEKRRSVEIRDFDSFPMGIGNVLTRSEYVHLIANSFIKSLVDLGADKIKNMKGFWVEGCQKMEHVVVNYTEVDAMLEILWISNARSLKSLESLCGDGQKSRFFQNLNCLYLDSCPELSEDLFPSDLPQNLTILHITFCEKLESLFGYDPEKQTLLKLHTLRLWELPELQSIGCKLPSLKVLEVGECPILENILPSSHAPQDLQVLKIRNCQKMDTLFEGITSGNLKLHNLKEVRLLGLPKLSSIGIEMPPLCVETLEVKDCPMLAHVFSSSQMPDDHSVL